MKEQMQDTDLLKEKMGLEDRFTFACGPDVPCFTECCGKLELLLTPYDVLRLKKKLGMTAESFLDAHTEMRGRTAHGFPEFLMKMDPESKRCPFVRPEGCSVYEDRPGACRIYPLGRASTMNPLDSTMREFYFTVREDHCRGFETGQDRTVREWLADQGMGEYNKTNDGLMELYVLRKRGGGARLTEAHLRMFVMALYNMEKFREFVFGSGFLKKFVVPKKTVDRIRWDDEALLKFAFDWLKFALFGRPTLTPKR